MKIVTRDILHTGPRAAARVHYCGNVCVIPARSEKKKKLHKIGLVLFLLSSNWPVQGFLRHRTSCRVISTMHQKLRVLNMHVLKFFLIKLPKFR